MFALILNAEQRHLFFILIFAHFIGAFGASWAERARMVGIAWISIITYVFLALIVFNIDMPMFADHYPTGIKRDPKGFNFEMDGEKILVWGMFYFGIVATFILHEALKKHPVENQE